MNNKSDKKHKRKQKQKQSKTKKKTASRQSKKKKEIKSGGAGWFKGLFSGKKDESSKMKELRQPLLQNLQNNASSALPNPQQSTSSNPQQLVSSNPQQSVSSNPQQLVSSNLQQSASSNPQQLVSSNGSYNSKTKITSNRTNWKNKNRLSQLQQPLLSNSNRLANAQRANLNTHPRNVSQALDPTNRNNSLQTVSQPPPLPPPPPPPNAQPQGFKTIESQSRCSIL